MEKKFDSDGAWINEAKESGKKYIAWKTNLTCPSCGHEHEQKFGMFKNTNKKGEKSPDYFVKKFDDKPKPVEDVEEAEELF